MKTQVIALAALITAIGTPARAEFLGWNLDWPWLDDFELVPALHFEGAGGYDVNLGRNGSGNAWLRGSEPQRFVSATTTASAFARGDCAAGVWIHGSPNLSNLYFSVLDASTGSIIAETGPLNGADVQQTWFPSCAELRSCQIGEVPSPGGWAPGVQLGVALPFAIDRNVRLRVGFWGNGQDSWLRIDDFDLRCTPGISGGL